MDGDAIAAVAKSAASIGPLTSLLYLASQNRDSFQGTYHVVAHFYTT